MRISDWSSDVCSSDLLGETHTVSGLERGALWDYLRAHYGPQQMVVAAAGKIEHHAFVEQVGAAFTHERFACNGATDPAAYRRGDRRAQRDLEQAHLLIGFDGVGHLDARSQDDRVRSGWFSTFSFICSP